MKRPSFDLIFNSLQGKKPCGTCGRTARTNTTKIYKRDWEAKLYIKIINKNNIGKLKPWIENDEYFLLIKSIFRSP